MLVRLTSLLLVAGLCLTVFCSCNSGSETKSKPQAVSVKVQKIDAQAVDTALTLIGAMDSRNSVDLFPRIDGYIAAIPITPGMLVQKGQLLMEIDSLKEQAAVAAKQSSVELALADLDKEKGKLASLQAERESKQSMVEFNTLQYERYYWLEKRGVVATATVDQEDRDLKVSKSRLASLEADITAQKDVIARAKKRIDEARAESRAEQAELAYHTMRAPFSGIIGDIKAKVGDYVNPQTKLTKISQASPLEVNVQVPEVEAKEIHVGTPLEILDNDGVSVGHSSVFYVAPTVNLQNQSVLIKAQFPNLKSELRPDQTVQVKLTLNTGKAMRVPTEAISFVAGKAFLFVAKQGDGGALIARQQPVEISAIQDNMATVKTGLQPGDDVIVSGIQMLSDKTPIQTSEGQ